MDADEGGGRGVDRRHFLEHQGGVEAGQGQAAGCLGRIEATKPEFTRFGDGFFGKGAFGVPSGGMGRELGLGERPGRFGIGALFFA